MAFSQFYHFPTSRAHTQHTRPTPQPAPRPRRPPSPYRSVHFHPQTTVRAYEVDLPGPRDRWTPTQQAQAGPEYRTSHFRLQIPARLLDPDAAGPDVARNRAEVAAAERWGAERGPGSPTTRSEASLDERLEAARRAGAWNERATASDRVQGVHGGGWHGGHAPAGRSRSRSRSRSRDRSSGSGDPRRSRDPSLGVSCDPSPGSGRDPRRSRKPGLGKHHDPSPGGNQDGSPVWRRDVRHDGTDVSDGGDNCALCGVALWRPSPMPEGTRMYVEMRCGHNAHAACGTHWVRAGHFHCPVDGFPMDMCG